MIGLFLRDIVERDNVSIGRTASLQDLIIMMNANGKGVAVVVRDGKPEGILTERDVVGILYAGGDLQAPAYRYVKKQLVTAKGDRTLFYALSLMIENNIRRLVVTGEGGAFLGVLTQQDLVRYLEEDFYRSKVRVRHIFKKIRPLLSLPPDAPIKKVLAMMVRHAVSSVPIVEEGRAVGIITEKDILRLSEKGFSPAEPACRSMSHPVVTSTLDAPLYDIVKVMSTAHIRRVVIIDGEGKAVGIVTDRDLLRNLEGDFGSLIERKLKHTKDVLNLFPEMLVEIIDAGKEQCIIWANEKVVSRFGPEILGRPVTDLIPPEKWETVHDTLRKCARIEEIRFKKNDHIFEISGFSIKTDMQEERGRIQLILRDITEDVKLYTTDPLTGLYNRRFLNEFLLKELERSRRMQRRFSLALIDLDNFKELNDTHSHAAGDAVLREIACLMGKNVRKADVIARYGGEEFVIIMPETRREAALPVLERLRKGIAQESIPLPEGKRVSITASFGLAAFPDDGESSADLLITADDRLYKAKRNGKNCIRCAD
ncbi:MAG: diguanylate cyclase [Thermodesulfovibrionales bacterium]